MSYLIISLFVLGAIAFVLGYIRNRSLKKKLERGEITELPSIKQVEDMECCGQHEVCERDSLLAAVSKEIEYYNDEELDRYKGRASDDYTDEEAEEFSEVMLTMRPEEVKGWNRSLILRGINMPNQIKDEFIALTE